MKYGEIIELCGGHAYWRYYNEDGDHVVEVSVWADQVDLNCPTIDQMYHTVIENGANVYIIDEDYDQYLNALANPHKYFAQWIDCEDEDALECLIRWAKENT